jgi:hypothetical protein
MCLITDMCRFNLESQLFKLADITKEDKMPGLNGTGPAGMGPMTGRGMGPCGDGTSAYTGFSRRAMGMRVGRGYGCGMGYGRGFGPAYGSGFGAWTGEETDPEGMKQILEERRNALKRHIEALDKRLETL